MHVGWCKGQGGLWGDRLGEGSSVGVAVLESYDETPAPSQFDLASSPCESSLQGTDGWSL